MERNEEQVEMLYEMDKRVGFYDEKGVLFIAKVATKEDRAKLYPQKSGALEDNK